MRWASGLSLVVMTILIGGASCEQREQTVTTSATSSGLRTVSMPIGSKTFTLEVADTSLTQQKGLMQRDSMPPEHGMIFVFPDEQVRGFYMRNTRIPLDIVFAAANGRVVSIKQMKPYDLTTTYSDGKAKWAIELNAGTVATTGLKVGDTLAVPAGAREATKE